jgi:hypothetical protein
VIRLATRASAAEPRISDTRIHAIRRVPVAASPTNIPAIARTMLGTMTVASRSGPDMRPGYRDATSSRPLKQWYQVPVFHAVEARPLRSPR